MTPDEYKTVKACFLSHIHSDHLVGLEALRCKFVYCSAATRELLLRLERYSDRINLAKGILEGRLLKYDSRELKGMLRPVPLNVPTEIELRPGRSIRVTLLPVLIVLLMNATKFANRNRQSTAVELCGF